MTPAAILKQAQADGLSLTLTGRGTMLIKGPQPAVDRWKPALRECKAGLLALLQAASSAPWDAADWRAYRDERAAVAEFDGGLSRRDAEGMAYRSCVSEWLCRHPQVSAPGSCAHCGRGDLAGRIVMPYGDAVHGHIWLHGECWPAWYAQRRQAAVEALAGFGIGGGE